MLSLLIIIICIIWIIYLHNRILSCEQSLKNISVMVNKLCKNLNSDEYSIIQTEKPIDEQNTDSFQEDFYEPASVLKTSDKKFSLQSFFLGNLFTIIGAIVLIIGVGLFIKLISPYIIFTPLLKTLAGFLLGLGLIITSCNIKKDKLRAYSEVLMGTGFSILFLTVLLTTVYFKTFSMTTCIFIGAVILVMAYFAAEKQKTVSMISVALIGGYLNILFSAFNIDVSLAFGYIIFLNILSVIYAYRNPKNAVINIINLIIGLLLISLLMIFKEKVSVIYPIVLWIVYLIYDLINNSDNFKNYHFLNWMNLAALTVFSLIIFQKEKLYIGLLLIFAAIVYDLISIYFIRQNSDKFKPYLYSMFTSLLLAVYFLTEGILRIGLWSLTALIICIVAVFYKKDYLKKWILVFFIPSVTNLFFIPEITYSLVNYTPVFNIRSAVYLVMIILSMYFARQTKNEFYKYLAVSLGFILLSLEAFDFVDKSNSINVNWIISIVWLLYSGLITTIGILKNKSYLKNIGIFTCLLTLFRIFFYDLTNIETLYRVIIFISFGAVFMIISYLYNREKE